MKLRALAIYVASLSFAVGTGYPSDEPPWVSKPPADDSSYRYYVGRATNAEEAEAVRQAFERAKEEAIRENFGIATRIQSQTYEGSQDLSVTRRTDEESSKVWLKDFEQKDFYKNGSSYWVLYRYSKAAISAEKSRLAAGSKEKAMEYSKSIGNSNTRGGVEITTDPDDVAIFIDNEQWGKTPQSIINKLDVGKHSLKLEHPDFNTIHEDLIITPHSRVKIKKTMVRAEGTIKISTSPLEDAIVFIHGKKVGLTPMEFKIPAGIPTEVRIEHPQAHPVATQVQVSKYQVSEIHETLILKPAHLSINSKPAMVEILIDGQRIGTTPIYSTSIPARKFMQITAKKDGYRSAEQTVLVNGGASKTISFELTSISQSEQQGAFLRSHTIEIQDNR